MKYAWYTEDYNTGLSFCRIENEPMQLDDALRLTRDTSEDRAFSVPAFETDIIAKKVNYDEDYMIDGKHSLLSEIAFEEWLGQNYMAISNKISSEWRYLVYIKELYNIGFIRSMYTTKTSVTIRWADRYNHNKEHKYVLLKSKNFENKSFEMMAGEDYDVVLAFCKENLA